MTVVVLERVKGLRGDFNRLLVSDDRQKVIKTVRRIEITLKGTGDFSEDF